MRVILDVVSSPQNFFEVHLFVKLMFNSRAPIELNFVRTK